MSKLKKPVGFFEHDKNPLDNNHKIEITAKRLDAEEAGSLGDQDILPQSVQDTSRLSVQEVNILGAQMVERPSDQTSERPEDQASKRQDAQKLSDQTSQRLEAIPLDAQIPSQLNAEPQNGGPTERQVDKPSNHLSDEETKPLAGETPKKKKTKSASLVKKTYYIDHDLDGAIELMAVLQKGDQSDIVRQLLRSAIPEYYLTQWKVMSDHSK